MDSKTTAGENLTMLLRYWFNAASLTGARDEKANEAILHNIDMN